MKCERCGEEGAEPRPSMTAYVDEEGHATEEKNPRPILCEPDWQEYREYWQERWDEYNSSRGL